MPHSNKSKNWRENNQNIILKWKKKFNELLDRRAHEWWDEEKFQMEIGNALEDQALKDIWFFAIFYISRYPRSSLSQFFSKAVEEIKNFGTLEPSRKNHLLKSTQTTRRKMNVKR